MRIAFYAPMKAPDDPVPSGDREMARALLGVLRGLGHSVELVSRFRSYTSKASLERLAQLQQEGAREVQHLAALWQVPGSAPQLWFTYHPYYKSPDFLGPAISAALAIPYVTVEASYAGKRNFDEWAPFQAQVVSGLRNAAINFAMTAQDREGLIRLLGERAAVTQLPPFIDTQRFIAKPAKLRAAPGTPVELICVAMMRAGAKLKSYQFLAQALATILHLPWRLTIVGDGPARAQVEASFAPLPPERIVWMGAVAAAAVPQHLACAELYVWPGFDEAYGLAYLEAQAAGLAVAALDCGGVADALLSGETALLEKCGASPAQYGLVIALLVADGAMRARLGCRAWRFVLEERGLSQAGQRLQAAFNALALGGGGA